MKENRVVFVDYLRVVACFLVMLVHASENFYAADASGLAGNVSMLANEQNRFWVAFYDGTLGRISVPLFMLAIRLTRSYQSGWPFRVSPC